MKYNFAAKWTSRSYKLDPMSNVGTNLKDFSERDGEPRTLKESTKILPTYDIFLADVKKNMSET